APMEALQLLFGFAEESRIGNSNAFRVDREGLQAHINADLFVGWLMGEGPLRFHGKLNKIVICPLDQSDTRDLSHREGGNAWALVAFLTDQTHRANTPAIGEGEPFAIGFQLPTSILVFNGTVSMLETRITFLPRLLLPAVHAEAGNREPGVISTGLAGLRVE